MSALELNTPAPPAPPAPPAWWRAVRWRAHAKTAQGVLVTHFLPIIFFVAILWAMLWPAPGKAVVEVTVRRQQPSVTPKTTHRRPGSHTLASDLPRLLAHPMPAWSQQPKPRLWR